MLGCGLDRTISIALIGETMKLNIFTRVLFSVAVILGWFKAVGYSFYAMNLNSDLFAVSGLFGVLIATYLLYVAINLTWRKHETK